MYKNKTTFFRIYFHRVHDILPYISYTIQKYWSHEACQCMYYWSFARKSSRSHSIRKDLTLSLLTSFRRRTQHTFTNAYSRFDHNNKTHKYINISIRINRDRHEKKKQHEKIDIQIKMVRSEVHRQRHAYMCSASSFRLVYFVDATAVVIISYCSLLFIFHSPDTDFSVLRVSSDTAGAHIFQSFSHSSTHSRTQKSVAVELFVLRTFRAYRVVNVNGFNRRMDIVSS